LDENYRCIDAAPEGVNSLLLVGNPAVTKDRVWVRGIGDDLQRGWLGADGDGSFRMPDGNWCWLFGDTFLGKVQSESLFHARRDPETMHTPRNSIGIMRFSKWNGHWAPSKMTYYVGAYKSNQKYPSYDPYVFCDDNDNGFSWLTPKKAAEGFSYWPKAGTETHDDDKGILIFCYLLQQSTVVRNDMYYVAGAREENIAEWDKMAERIPLPEVLQCRDDNGSVGIGWIRVTQLGDGEILLQGWEQRPVMPGLFLARGRPRDFLNDFDKVAVWGRRDDRAEPGWFNGLGKNGVKLTSIELRAHDAKPTGVLSGTSTSEIYRHEDQWCFLAMNSFSGELFDNAANTKGFALERYATKPGAGPEGPYYRSKRHIYRFPNWSRDFEHWNLYALRAHPELKSSLLTPEEDLSLQGYKLENVVSWIAQPWFPYWSSDMFSPNLIYKAYQPLLIFVWRKTDKQNGFKDRGQEVFTDRIS
jgi:hypothetical protein